MHQTTSTLAVIAFALGVFVVFGGALNWIRQYLVTHTGNRVDAVLGAAVFRHLLRLANPLFRATPHRRARRAAQCRRDDPRVPLGCGDHAASSTCRSCGLFLALMFFYSAWLSLLTLLVLTLVMRLSLVVAPLAPDAAQRAVPAGCAQPGVRDGIRRRHRDGQVAPDGAAARAPVRGISRRLPARQFQHTAARQYVQHGRQRTRAVPEHGDSLPRRVARDAGSGLHDRHAGRVPDVRVARIAADAAARRAMAAVPAGGHCGSKARGRDERARRSRGRSARPANRRTPAASNFVASASAMQPTAPMSCATSTCASRPANASC